MAKKYGFVFFKEKDLAGDKTSIKDVFLDMTNKIKFKKYFHMAVLYL